MARATPTAARERGSWAGWVGTKVEFLALLEMLEQRFDSERKALIAQKTASISARVSASEDHAERMMKHARVNVEAMESYRRHQNEQLAREQKAPLAEITDEERDEEYALARDAKRRAEADRTELEATRVEAERDLMLKMRVVHRDGSDRTYTEPASTLVELASERRVRDVTISVPGGYSPSMSLEVSFARGLRAYATVTGTDSKWVDTTIGTIRSFMARNNPWWLKFRSSVWLLGVLVALMWLLVAVRNPWADLAVSDVVSVSFWGGIVLFGLAYAAFRVIQWLIPAFEVFEEGSLSRAGRLGGAFLAFIAPLVATALLDI